MAARRLAKRNEEYEARQAKWDQRKQSASTRDRERGRRRAARAVSWLNVVAGLELALDATGDPIFSEALTCLKAYGLHEGGSKSSYLKAQASVFGDMDLGYLQNMKWLLDNQPNRFRSARSAAEEVAAYYFYNADSFDAAVQGLRKKYGTWKRMGYQSQEMLHHQGDAGYLVNVRPTSQANVPIPGRECLQRLPAEGMVVCFTSYWRHRFHDGDVWILKVR